MEIRDKVDTLPQNILQLVAERLKNNQERYAPSYIARILSKSISDEHQKKYQTWGFRKGHFVEKDPLDYSMELPTSIFTNIS